MIEFYKMREGETIDNYLVVIRGLYYIMSYSGEVCYHIDELDMSDYEPCNEISVEMLSQCYHLLNN